MSVLLTISCANMYSDLLEGTKLRVGIYIASSASDQMYIFNSEGIPVNANSRFPVAYSYKSLALDFDHDGDCDIARINNSGYLEIITNDGRGNFNSSYQLSVSVPVESFNVSDFNNDGIFDFVTTNGTTNIYLYSPGSSIPNLTGSNSYKCISIADLNNDKKPDIFAGTMATDNEHFYNTSSGSITFSTSTLHSTSVSGILGSTLVDIDNDGDNDLLTAANSTNYVYIYKNNGIGIFSGTHDSQIAHFSPLNVFIGDLNSDNYIDAVITSGMSNGAYMINDGTGNFIKYDMSLSVYNCALFDIDFDGDLDIICQSSSNTLRILKNDGNANFAVTAEVPGITSVGSITVFTYKED